MYPLLLVKLTNFNQLSSGFSRLRSVLFNLRQLLSILVCLNQVVKIKTNECLDNRKVEHACGVQCMREMEVWVP